MCSISCQFSVNTFCPRNRISLLKVTSLVWKCVQTINCTSLSFSFFSCAKLKKVCWAVAFASIIGFHKLPILKFLLIGPLTSWNYKKKIFFCWENWNNMHWNSTSIPFMFKNWLDNLTCYFYLVANRFAIRLSITLRYCYFMAMNFCLSFCKE